MRLRLAIWIAQTFGALSRLSKRGSGVMVTGRILLKLQPNAVRDLSRSRRVVLISGTNGKTTTTSLIHSALSLKEPAVSNFTGANLFAGIAAALGSDVNAKLAALEVDELVMPWAIKQTKPELVVLLNLGRDQLDRLSEVRMVAQKWREALKDLPRDCKILADADDPFVVWSAQGWPNVHWFSSGSYGHIDASTCPSCGAVLEWADSADNYWCACGFARPKPEWIMKDDVLEAGDGARISVISRIPGRAALANAGRAVAAASYFGISHKDAVQAISKIESVDGRFARLKIGDANFRLMLSKNPASWRETLATSASGPNSVMLVVNANSQDGKDTSWLWDVDFTLLKGRNVLASGDRRLDLSARLTVNGIPHHVVRDEATGAALLGQKEADLIASYTAFHRLAKLVKK